MTRMPNQTSTQAQADPVIVVKDPEAAALSAAGHWAETQVIETIKEANFLHKDPQRVLDGRATQQVGGIFHPVVGTQGELITPKRSLRSRLRSLLKFLSS